MQASIYLLKAAAIIGIFYLIYQFLLKKETHFGAIRIYLILGVIGSFLLPLWYFTTTTVVEIPALSQNLVSTAVPVSEFASNMETIPAREFDWYSLVFYVYASIAAVFLLRFLFQLGQLILLIQSNPKKRSGAFTYVEIEDGKSPFSFLHYICYNPQANSAEELDMILKHEQVHVYQWHTADILLANILVILQWANPFAWLYRKSINENLEFLADEGTIAEVDSKKEYQLALIRATGQTVPALTTSFYQSFIKKRIIMLNKQSSRPVSLLKIILIIPLLAIFLYSFNTKEETHYKEVVIPQSKPVISGSSTEAPAQDRTSEFTESSEKGELAVNDTESTPSNTEDQAATNEVLVAAIPDENQNAFFMLEDVKFRINKNTTDKELQAIKDTLKKEHELDLNYSVTRNSANEITSIAISFTGGKRNGSYMISGDEPIDEFYFFINDDGESGFWSEAAEERRAERELARAQRLEERSKERMERRKEMEMRRNEIRKEMEERRKEMQETHNEMIIEHEKEQGKMQEEAEKRYKIARVKSAKGMEFDDDDLHQEVVVVQNGNGNMAKVERIHHNRRIVISKDSNDKYLARIKEKLAGEGIDFKYSKVRRNDNGELTRIKIVVVDNKHGKKQTSTAESDDGKPIDDVIIDLD